MSWSISISGHDGESMEERAKVEADIYDKAKAFVADLVESGYHPSTSNFYGNTVSGSLGE